MPRRDLVTLPRLRVNYDNPPVDNQITRGHHKADLLDLADRYVVPAPARVIDDVLEAVGPLEVVRRGGRGRGGPSRADRRRLGGVPASLRTPRPTAHLSACRSPTPYGAWLPTRGGPTLVKDPLCQRCSGRRLTADDPNSASPHSDVLGRKIVRQTARGEPRRGRIL
jgi:hypothetical protein